MGAELSTDTHSLCKENVAVTQNDVRAIQLAKAALHAGFRLLMDKMELKKVDRVVLAGAFGTHIDPKYAMVLGMIPDCELENVRAVGNSAGTGARCSSASMHICFAVFWRVEVENTFNSINVDTSGGHIGGDENVDFAGAECAQRLFTRSLPEITMYRSHGEAPLGEIVGDLLRLPLRAREDHRQAAVFRLQNACQQLHLVHRVSAPDVLFDRIDGCAVISGVDRSHVGRLVHVATRESDDLARHGGGEQHRLPVGGNECDDSLDVRKEPHVEHLVRLVEHELAHVRQIEVASTG